MRPPPTPRLAALLAGVAEVAPSQDRLLSGISCDSRQIGAGELFLALPGGNHHGLDFLPDVRVAGAAAVAWDAVGDSAAKQISVSSSQSLAVCPLIEVPGLACHVGMLADRFYGDPSRHLHLIGITGTDGKTSCAYYLAQCLESSAAPCALLGTLGYGLVRDVDTGALTDAGLTTPDAITLRRWLASARSLGADYGVMEVSSHGLAQARPDGLTFEVAVLSNLTRDHLDYHGDLEAYAAAKQRLFVDLDPRRIVVNLDDSFGRRLMAARSRSATVVYGTGAKPDDLGLGQADDFVWARSVTPGEAGLRLEIKSSWGEGVVETRLLGRFNASNLLATLATLLTLKMPFNEALRRLARVKTAPGRMESFGGGGSQPLAVVDYAHTPHALEQALRALREHRSGLLWCVFGCGGERDRGKRPLMGANAERWADRIIVTNDNPRAENPATIADGILRGMREPDRVAVELDRSSAIHRALSGAAANDIVLIAGKGHEDYQMLAGQRIDFSDRAVVCEHLGQAA